MADGLNVNRTVETLKLMPKLLHVLPINQDTREIASRLRPMHMTLRYLDDAKDNSFITSDDPWILYRGNDILKGVAPSDAAFDRVRLPLSPGILVEWDASEVGGVDWRRITAEEAASLNVESARHCRRQIYGCDDAPLRAAMEVMTAKPFAEDQIPIY